MDKGRLEAFSDGVIAIIITIMVLELKVPTGADLGALRPVTPVFLSYVLSFVFVGIYWNNHHHMFQAVEHINGRILWANLHLLFWISLFPFCTAWMGENHFAPTPVALYGADLLLAAIAYYMLAYELQMHHGRDSAFAHALGKGGIVPYNTKGAISAVIYAAAIPLAFVRPWLAYSAYVLVALMWLVPDRRFEK